MGLLPPVLVHNRDGDPLDEDAEHVVVHLRGLGSAPAASGGLLFGIRYLLKDQLNHFRRLESQSESASLPGGRIGELGRPGGRLVIVSQCESGIGYDGQIGC